jgi:hypothetical protein
MDQKQVEGSEPVVKLNDAGDAEMTWGRWTITAWIAARSYGEFLRYTVNIEFHGDNDGGETGMYGTLSADMGDSPESVALHALNAMQYRITSDHQEENEDDTSHHVRTLDLAPLLVLAADAFKAASKAEAAL